jgi:hypothetical protein
LPKIVRKMLNIAESPERLQARMPAAHTAKYIAIRELALLRGGCHVWAANCSQISRLQLAVCPPHSM